MTNDNTKKYVVIKAATPSSLKLQFKVLCTKKKLTMSKVMEDLIKKWIETKAPIAEFSYECSKPENEDVKAYIPENLKLKFKVLCVENQVTMRFTLCNLIHQWVQQNQ